MPATPIVDVTSLDLTRTVVSKKEIYTLLRHTGRFALLDGVLHFDPNDKVCVGFKDIRADDWWAPDHIPGRPIFPGVLMIEAAAHLASWDYLKRHPERTEFIGFGGVNETRFRGIVEPGTRLILVAQENRVRGKMFIYGVQGFRDGEMVLETEVIGAAM
jgi:3-hydroxyacyl-[acyl-carrier-protein] dehydratase